MYHYCVRVQFSTVTLQCIIRYYSMYTIPNTYIQLMYYGES